MTMTENPTTLLDGRIVSIAGPVVDVEFPAGSLPEINHAVVFSLDVDGTIEEIWGEAKCWHGFWRFQLRGLRQVRDDAYLMGWLLNLKRLATLLTAPA